MHSKRLGIQRTKRLRICKIVDLNPISTTEQAFPQPREIGNLHIEVFAAHKIDEVFVRGIPQMVRDRWGWETNKIPRPYPKLFSSNSGIPATREIIVPFFFWVMEVEDKSIFSRRTSGRPTLS